MSKRWPFKLAAIIVTILGVTLQEFGSRYGIPEYVGWSFIALALTIDQLPQTPRKRRWLALGTFFALVETGFLLPWHNGMTFFISILLIIAGFLAVTFIPPRMKVLPAKANPEAPA